MAEANRILHVLGRLNRGGAETMVMNIYRNIDRSKVQFDFMIHTADKCDFDDEIHELGGRIYNVPRYYGKNHFEYKRAWNEFFKNHPENKLVHGHIRSTAAIYLKIAKKHGRVTIAHSHSTSSRGNKVEQLFKNILQLPIRYTADYLFACSDEAGKWLFGEKATKGDHYRVIKNAIDINKYVFNKDVRDQIRKRLNIEDRFVVGHVGSFTPPKNHKFLITVFDAVQKQNENAVLLLVGDGELKPQIEEQINYLGLKEKVRLTGVVSNANDYLQAMDVFVFPSIYEGLGIAAIEAQAAGLPCIVSDAIPHEAHISNLLIPLSTQQTSQCWATLIVRHATNRERGNIHDDVKCAGYDIEMTAKILEDFYEKNYIFSNMEQ
jgi:glycosyltransferase involved in cell wall biosynthesis